MCLGKRAALVNASCDITMTTKHLEVKEMYDMQFNGHYSVKFESPTQLKSTLHQLILSKTLKFLNPLR